MSMTQLTILQCVSVFCAYSFLTLLLPSFVLRNLVKERCILERMIFYFMCGNFYVANIVYILELLHLSYRITLITATVVIAAVVWARLNGKSFHAIFEKYKVMAQRMAAQQLGTRTMRLKIRKAIGWRLKRFLKRALRAVFIQLPDLVLCAGVVAGLCYIYGSFMLRSYGYVASDIPVHLYWINQLSENDIFTAGVYPYGYHCIIYFMHIVFGIDSYVIMRVMGFVQTCFIYFMLLGFLKLCCKSRFLPYAGIYIFLFSDCFGYLTYFRYRSALPQEFGMLFILPCAFYAFHFFELYREEQKSGTQGKKYMLDLAGLAMSFAMTLSVHFYGTMIAGLFCVAIGIGYFYLTLRPKYLKKLVITALISLFIAVLPMGIAFATGTPLQGSLNWGMSIINGPADDEEGDASGNAIEDASGNALEDASGNAIEDASGNALGDASGNPSVDVPISGDAADIGGLEESTPSISERIMALYEKTKRFEELLWERIDERILTTHPDWLPEAFRYCMGILLAEGLLCMIVRRPCYGSMLWSTAIFWLMMDVFSSAGLIGLPELMDINRSAIYYAYIVVIPFVFAADGVLVLLFQFLKWKWPMQLLSFAGMCLILNVMLGAGTLRKPFEPEQPFQTNESVICLTNIIAQEEDEKWTICSAGDETQMVYGHGWHYEIIDFLRKMENTGADGYITIPTETVYFFIEKIPTDSSVSYEGSGQTVSEKGAQMALPAGSGNSTYQGENRFICMSRMYYWVQEFQKLYPNEIKVYFEDDNFICYRMKQNTYRLYNFAIDYGYNEGED